MGRCPMVMIQGCLRRRAGLEASWRDGGGEQGGPEPGGAGEEREGGPHLQVLLQPLVLLAHEVQAVADEEEVNLSGEGDDVGRAQVPAAERGGN